MARTLYEAGVEAKWRLLPKVERDFSQWLQKASLSRSTRLTVLVYGLVVHVLLFCLVVVSAWRHPPSPHTALAAD